MKKIFKVVLLVASCTVFLSTSYADSNKDAVAKGIADGAKQMLLEQYKKFPIKLDDISYITNITANKQNVIYDYKILMPSDKFTPEIIASVIITKVKGQVCSSQDFINIFKENDLRFLYRYQFSDKKTIPVTLSLDEICN